MRRKKRIDRGRRGMSEKHKGRKKNFKYDNK